MTKNVKRTLSLKKVTVATLGKHGLGSLMVDEWILLGTPPTSYTTASKYPTCRFYTLK